MIMRKVTSDDPYIAESGHGRKTEQARRNAPMTKMESVSKRQGERTDGRRREKEAHIGADGGGTPTLYAESRGGQGADTPIHRPFLRFSIFIREPCT